MYFKYLAAAFGSALISSIYGVVDMAMVGQYQGPEGTAAVIGVVILAVVIWLAVIFFDRELLLLFGAEETLLPPARRYLFPVKFVVPSFLFTQLMAAFLRNDGNPAAAGANAIWFAMPITELLVVIYVAIRMVQNVSLSANVTKAEFVKRKM